MTIVWLSLKALDQDNSLSGLSLHFTGIFGLLIVTIWYWAGPRAPLNYV